MTGSLEAGSTPARARRGPGSPACRPRLFSPAGPRSTPPGRAQPLARMANGYMSGCFIFQRPAICSITSLESIRTSTAGLRVHLPSHLHPGDESGVLRDVVGGPADRQPFGDRSHRTGCPGPPRRTPPARVSARRRPPPRSTPAAVGAGTWLGPLPSKKPGPSWVSSGRRGLYSPGLGGADQDPAALLAAKTSSAGAATMTRTSAALISTGSPCNGPAAAPPRRHRRGSHPWS